MKKGNTKQVPVMFWRTKGSDEPACVYRLDDSDDAKRFFRDILANAEEDGSALFSVGTMTRPQWNKCVVEGNNRA